MRKNDQDGRAAGGRQSRTTAGMGDTRGQAVPAQSAPDAAPGGRPDLGAAVDATAAEERLGEPPMPEDVSSRARSTESMRPEVGSGAKSAESVTSDDASGAEWAEPVPLRPASIAPMAESLPPEKLASTYLDQLQRLKAEFDNYRRRISREKEEWFEAARAGVIQQLLPAVEDLRRARNHCQAPGDVPDAAGLYLILKRFEDLLGQLGLSEQDAHSGLPFDPEQHEAVMALPSEEIPEGDILQLVEPGYLFQGRLLRRSKVCVSSGPAPE